METGVGSILGMVVIVFGWKFITIYPPKVRTIVFWFMNIAAGILGLAFIVILGSHMDWEYVFLMFGAIAFGFWLGEEHPKYPDAQIRRRGILSVWEDFILLLDAFVISAGLILIGVLLERGFLGR